jgi:tetratricopeptide (TPR) repeat protein
MPRPIPPLESLVLYLLRRRQGWLLEDLATADGSSVQDLSTREVGRRDLDRARLAELAAPLGYDAAEVDRLLDQLAWLYDESAAAPPPASPVDPTPEERRQIAEVVARFGRPVLELLEENLVGRLRRLRAEQARREAEVQAAELLRRPAEDRRPWVEQNPDLQTWALAERLAHASEDAASDHADRALELARLACRVAELAPGSPAWQARLQGYCGAFRANALRVRNDMQEAGADFTAALHLWAEGAPADPGLLAAWRVLDLEVSLRRDQRRFSEALERADQALAAAPPELAGRILAKKAVVYEHMGEPARAIEVLHRAAPLIDGRREPRLVCVLRFNLIANLCHLDRFSEAEALLPEVELLAVQGRRELDLLRVKWLRGRIAAGRGRDAEARAAFEQARGELAARAMAYDCALVTLELAALDLEQGRPARVRRLAGEMAWIFNTQGIHREALAALDLFCHAAAQEEANAELARKIVRYLYRSRHDPNRPFEP